MERSVAQCADLEHKVGDALTQLNTALQLLGEMRDQLRGWTEDLARAEARAAEQQARAEAVRSEAREAGRCSRLWSTS